MALTITETRKEIVSSVNEGEFKRIEDKYLVPRALEQQVFNRLSENMDESYLDTDTHYTLIESIYFDSADVHFFKDHFNSAILKRYKMRVRRYGPNGVWNTENYLLEVKRKKEGACKKVRFTIGQPELDVISAGLQLELTERIISLNSKMKLETLKKRVAKVNELIETYGLVPARSVRYKRYAFEKNGFRATIDIDLVEGPLIDLTKVSEDELLANNIWEKANRLVNKFNGEDKLILELKHGGEIPQWATDMLKEFDIVKTSFSKYCYFTARDLKKTHQALENYIPTTIQENSQPVIQ